MTGGGGPAGRERVALVLDATQLTLWVEPRTTLAEALAEAGDWVAVPQACEDGSCGSCTVIVDGRPVRACLLFAVQVEGAEVRTVASLADGADLHPLQQAFIDNFAIKCGLCTPGYLVLALAVLERDGTLADEAIEEILAANLCRCTGYRAIGLALKAARQQLAARAAGRPRDGAPSDAS